MSTMITGASGGIGEACARVFAAAGQDLVLVARRADRLSALAGELVAKHGVRVAAHSLDVRSRESVEAFLLAHPRLLDGVDVLVNNAGLAKGRDPIQSGSADDWDDMIDTNLKGLLYVTRAMLPGLIRAAKQGRSAHIVNVGSVAGHWTYPDGNVYCATKAAVRALNEAMRLDLHGTGVRVTEIAPGMVKTGFSQVRFGGDQAKADAVYAGVDCLTPQDVAEAVHWCVQRPRRVNIQELVIYPTDQASVTLVKRAPGPSAG